ncbi:MAG: metal ABC transporter substrate-binding protein [Candidatus Bathyarchaeota archaeon]|nr:metal ABC transporter substrate-binding protein [Candidatus Bathyarchaeota archaeon]
MNRKQKTLIATTIIVIIAIAAASALLIAPPKSANLKIVATFYPLAFLSHEIGGDHIEVIQLVPNNTELHSWEPTASHIVATEDADIIVCNGAGADHWMEEDILPSLSNSKTRTVVVTTNGLNLVLSDSEEHEEETHEEEHEHGLYDPHTWLSPYMVKLQAEKIYNAIVQADPAHESDYQERWLNLKSTLEQLDAQYAEGLSTKQKDAIFVSHAAYGYLASRYGFEQHGVIGLTADEQPSAATIGNIVNLMIEHETYVVYVDPVYSSQYAQTLKNELQTQTGQQVTILELYLMLGPTGDKDYFGQMQTNLANLETGLQAK